MHRMIRTLVLATLFALSVASQAQARETSLREGVVEHITEVQIGRHHHHGLAAIIGAGVGYGVGGLVGGGHGRDVARIAGELAGSVAAVEQAKKSDGPVSGEQIVVRLGNGVLVAITQPGPSDLRIGQAVLVEGTGDQARVVAR